MALLSSTRWSTSFCWRWRSSLGSVGGLILPCLAISARTPALIKAAFEVSLWRCSAVVGAAVLGTAVVGASVLGPAVVAGAVEVEAPG